MYIGQVCVCVWMAPSVRRSVRLSEVCVCVCGVLRPSVGLSVCPVCVCVWSSPSVRRSVRLSAVCVCGFVSISPSADVFACPLCVCALISLLPSRPSLLPSVRVLFSFFTTTLTFHLTHYYTHLRPVCTLFYAY